MKAISIRTIKRVFCLSLISLALSACSSTARQVGTSGFSLASYEEVSLSNGVRILFIKDSSLPRVSLHALVKSGSIHDPKGKEGVNQMVVDLLNDGTATMSSPEVAKAFAQIGADYSSDASFDYSYIAASSISTHQLKMLELLSAVLLEPAFSDKEVTRSKRQLIAKIRALSDNPSAMASRALQVGLYENHPYGHMPSGSLASVQSLKRSDIIRHYFKYFRPNNTIFAVVGDYSKELEAAVKTRLGQWTKAEVPKLDVAKLEAKPANTLTVLQKRGLKQSQIRIGQIGIERQNKDFLALKAANVALGGAFASRLTKKVRKELGLTYSIWSYFDARLFPGPFVVSTFSRNEKASDAITESIKLLDETIEKGINQEELYAAKAVLVGQFPSAIETGDGLAFNLLLLRYYGVSDEYLSDFMDKVDDLSLAEVNAALKAHLKPGAWNVIIHADEAATPIPESVGPIQKKGFKEIL